MSSGYKVPIEKLLWSAVIDRPCGLGIADKDGGSQVGLFTLYQEITAQNLDCDSVGPRRTMNRRYGTFTGSTESERTELTAMEGLYVSGGESLSEMSLSAVHPDRALLRRQEAMVRNRLPLLCGVILHWLSDKGIVSILVSFHVGLIGLQMLSLTSDRSSWRQFAHFLFSCGMFGFLGGCTNWLAVSLLFRRIPMLCGSGVIGGHYQEICQSVRNSVINVFFDESFLERYSRQQLGQHVDSLDIDRRLQEVLELDDVDQIIDRELLSLAVSPEGQVLALAGISPASLKPLVKPFVIELVSEVVPDLLETLSWYSTDTGAKALKQEFRTYMMHRTRNVSSEQVTYFVRLVMYKHLSWLVVLGSVAGILLGVMSQLTGVGRLI